MFKILVFSLFIIFCVGQVDIEISQDEGNWTKYQGFKKGVFACGAYIYIVDSQQSINDDVAAYDIGFYGCNASDYKSNGSIDFSWNHHGVYIDDETEILYGRAFCPDQQFIFDYKLRVEEPQGDGDDTSVNGLAIYCQDPHTGDQLEVMVHQGLWGDWQTGFIIDDDMYICGAYAKYVDGPLLGGDNLALTGLRVKRCVFP